MFVGAFTIDLGGRICEFYLLLLSDLGRMIYFFICMTLNNKGLYNMAIDDKKFFFLKI